MAECKELLCAILTFLKMLLICLHGILVVACGLTCPLHVGFLVPRPGIEPASPALEGRFLSPGPLGQS